MVDEVAKEATAGSRHRPNQIAAPSLSSMPVGLRWHYKELVRDPCPFGQDDGWNGHQEPAVKMTVFNPTS